MTAVAALIQDIADAGRVQLEAKNKLERAMEQMIAANTAKEHARQKVCMVTVHCHTVVASCLPCQGGMRGAVFKSELLLQL